MMTQVGVSTATITNWAYHLRCLVTWDIENLDLADAPIGGDGVIVWVVGGVEITPERRMFAVSVQDRSADTLRAIIQDHVLPGI